MSAHLRGRSPEREAPFAALDAAIARGIADVDAGRVKPLSQVFDQPRAAEAELEAIGDWIAEANPLVCDGAPAAGARLSRMCRAVSR